MPLHPQQARGHEGESDASYSPTFLAATSHPPRLASPLKPLLSRPEPLVSPVRYRAAPPRLAQVTELREVAKELWVVARVPADGLLSRREVSMRPTSGPPKFSAPSQHSGSRQPRLRFPRRCGSTWTIICPYTSSYASGRRKCAACPLPCLPVSFSVSPPRIFPRVEALSNLVLRFPPPRSRTGQGSGGA